MDKLEIIERLKNIAGHAVHTVGEKPFVMSLDDGIAVHEAIELLEKTETNCPEIPDSWIPVSERMPEEKDTMFAKFYGTEMWHEGMPRQWSNMVEVTVELENGPREVTTSYTRDGKWEVENAQFAKLVPKKVVAWRPLPEPYKEGE